MNTERFHDLINGGDWACAQGEPEALAEVCRELSDWLEPGLADKAETIRQLADVNMVAATRSWGELAVSLRRMRESLGASVGLAARGVYSREVDRPL